MVTTKGKNLSLINKLKIETESLSSKDIDSWRQAHRLAVDIENPQRLNLYNIYDYTTILDTHLSGVISRTVLEILSKKFKIIDVKSIKEDVELTNILEAVWFKDFLKLSLMSVYYGYSLIEFGDKTETGFTAVKLVPRRHVIPEYGVIVKEVGEEPSEGISFLENGFEKTCIGVGNPSDLGLLLKCTPLIISKKHSIIYWNNYAEKFGIPMIIATTDSPNEEAKRELSGFIESVGNSAGGVVPVGTTITTVSGGTTDAFNVFKEMIKMADEQVSICLAGQTMVFNDGASRSQGEVHERGFKFMIEGMADTLRDVVNNQLLPFLESNGFSFADKRFDWDYSKEFSQNESLEAEKMLLEKYEVDPIYFSEKYNIPVSKKEDKVNKEPFKHYLNESNERRNGNHNDSVKGFFD